MTFLCCFFIFLAFEILCCSVQSCLGMPRAQDEIVFVIPRLGLCFSVLTNLSCKSPFYHMEGWTYKFFSSWEISWENRPSGTWVPGSPRPGLRRRTHFVFTLTFLHRKPSAVLLSTLGQGHWEVARVERSQNSQLLGFSFLGCPRKTKEQKPFRWTQQILDSGTNVCFALCLPHTWNQHKLSQGWLPFREARQLLWPREALPAAYQLSFLNGQSDSRGKM